MASLAERIVFTKRIRHSLLFKKILIVMMSLPTLLAFHCPAFSDLVIWANNGQDKVTQDELRAYSNFDEVHNSVWNGKSITLFGAKNEVIAFNLVLESPEVQTDNIRVQFTGFSGPDGFIISGRPLDQADIANDAFNYNERNVELFYVRYLQIKGFSEMSYDEAMFDERQMPKKFQRPIKSLDPDDPYAFRGQGTWYDRPDHDKFYPDIAVPIEKETPFSVMTDQNQSIWVDIFIPSNAPAGKYTGTLTIDWGTGNSAKSHAIETILTVRDFTLPNIPTAKTMVVGGEFGYTSMEERFGWDDADIIEQRYAQLFHRHKISQARLVSAFPSDITPTDMDCLTGDLFIPERGYDGPGIGTGMGVLSIGTYEEWHGIDISTGTPYDAGNGWLGGCYTEGQQKAAIEKHSKEWDDWIAANSDKITTPTEYFLYLHDEVPGYPGVLTNMQNWAKWLNDSSSRLKSMATIDPWMCMHNVPDLDIAATWRTRNTDGRWERTPDNPNAICIDEYFIDNPDKRLFLYNGSYSERGSFATEDEGVSLRVTAWAQFKKKIDLWYYWYATHYSNSYSGESVNLFETARTFGMYTRFDDGDGYAMGETGAGYSNGDGLLMYPGTDKLYPQDSYGLKGPIASLRLKFWRRGIQDTDYLALASEVDPEATQTIINRIIPKVLWEYGTGDKTETDGWEFVYHDISWSRDPDVWEQARLELANIIEGNIKTLTVSGKITVNGTGLSGVSLSGLPGNPKTNQQGEYIASVIENWSGTVTPTLAGYTFLPSFRNYNNITSDLTDQSYTAIASTNQPPIITLGPTAEPDTIKDNQTSIITVTASDPDPDDVLTYVWNSSLGTITGSDNQVTYTPPHVNASTIVTLTVTVSDGKGGQVDGSTTITVNPETVPNQPPIITFGPAAEPDTIKDNQTSIITVTASDPDPDDVLTYVWNSSLGTITGSGNQITYTPPHVNIPTIVTLTVTVSDGKGGQIDGSTTVTVNPQEIPSEEAQRPWSSNENLYPEYETDIHYSDVNTGYEFTPTVSGYISKVGGSFHGITKITLWKEAAFKNGVRSGTVITTVTLDASDNENYEWRFIDLPEPIMLQANQRYAVTMHVPYGVKVTKRSNVPHETQFGDILIHYPLIGDVDKTPHDYPAWNAPYMIGAVDIYFTPSTSSPAPSPPPTTGQRPWSSNENLYPEYETDIHYSDVNTGYEFTPTVSGYISKVGGSFHGITKITLWKDAAFKNGVRSGTVITTVTLDASDNENYEWKFVNLPEPVVLQANQRYAVTMHVPYGVKVTKRSNVSHETQFGDILIHYPLIGDVDKTPHDYPAWNAPYMIGAVDIIYVPGFLSEN